MKYKIVVDSSSDLLNDYIKDDNIGFEVVPLTIDVDGVSFKDDENLDVDQMLQKMKTSTTRSKTACPSVGFFSESYSEAEYVICITISSKLSGTYNSAYLGSSDIESKVHVVDSKLTAGAMRLLVDKTYELMKQDLPFDEIVSQIEEYRDSLHIFFVLDKFDNLVKNGRMSKIVAFIASALYIKPLCVDNDGTIDVFEKPRTMKGALNRLAESIALKVNDTSNRTCIITHCKNKEMAEYLQAKIKEKYNFKDVILSETRGLCSFYALEGGIIVSF